MTGSFLKDLMHRVGSLAVNRADAPADGDLLARFVRERDESAFAGLLTRHAPLVWGVCRGLLSHDADAEDAFQATFLALVRGAKNVRTTHTLAPWLHATATQVAKKSRLAASRRAARDRTAARSEANGAAVPDSAWDATFLAVHEEIARLPEATRSAFVLCVLEGERHADAAIKLGVPIGTLSARVSRARQRLMEKLTARGLAPSAAVAALALGGSAGPAAVPTSLMNTTCSTLLTGATVVPASVLTLARMATEGSVMKAKLLAAGVMVAAGLALSGGAARFGVAVAQTPPPGNQAMPPPADPRGNASAYIPHTTQRWEYKFAIRPQNDGEFERLLTDLGRQGWEYAGSELFKSETAVTNKVVFKRLANATYYTPIHPAPAPSSSASGTNPAPLHTVPYGNGDLFPGYVVSDTDFTNPNVWDMGVRNSMQSSAGPPANPAKPADATATIRVESSKATEVAAIISEIFNGPGKGGKVNVTADATNKQVLIRCTPADAATVVQLISKSGVVSKIEMDFAPAAKPNPPTSSSTAYGTRYDVTPLAFNPQRSGSVAPADFPPTVTSRTFVYPVPKGVTGKEAAAAVADLAKLTGLAITSEVSKDDKYLTISCTGEVFNKITAILPEVLKKQESRTK